ncbi:MAG: rRNA maturation RNase YbeY [Chitinophagaceae bacterium]|nr:rRNA maturation RNase YbeY [Chitinophagaceae bacterium]
MPVSLYKPKVHFYFEQKGFSLENRNQLKRFIEGIFAKEKKRLSHINYIFCSDKRLLEINRQFLNHDFYTDIIAFDLSEGRETEAEIYISIDRVRENSESLRYSFKSELHRVIFHGALHLCGYKDKKRSDIDKMRERESFYLSKYGINGI